MVQKSLGLLLNEEFGEETYIVNSPYLGKMYIYDKDEDLVARLEENVCLTTDGDLAEYLDDLSLVVFLCTEDELADEEDDDDGCCGCCGDEI